MSGQHPVGTRVMAHALAESDLRVDLPHIRVSTPGLHGGEDIRFPLAVAEGLRDGLPNARLVVLSGVGHECHLEAPDTVIATLRGCLTADGTVSG